VHPSRGKPRSFGHAVEPPARRPLSQVNRSQDKSVTAPTSAEVKQLREEVERLKREQADLRERLRKIEKKARE